MKYDDSRWTNPEESRKKEKKMWIISESLVLEETSMEKTNRRRNSGGLEVNLGSFFPKMVDWTDYGSSGKF